MDGCTSVGSIGAPVHDTLAWRLTYQWCKSMNPFRTSCSQTTEQLPRPRSSLTWRVRVREWLLGDLFLWAGRRVTYPSTKVTLYSTCTFEGTVHCTSVRLVELRLLKSSERKHISVKGGFQFFSFESNLIFFLRQNF